MSHVIGCIAAYQEGLIIERALASLARYCDRVIVVDGAREDFPLYYDSIRSTDDTLALALEYGAEVILPSGRAWHDEVEQRNAYLLGHPGDWYLILDADEVLYGELPNLVEPSGVYRVRVDDQGVVKRHPRLFREDGTVRYQSTHYGIYREGRLLPVGVAIDTLWIDNTLQRDVARQARRNAYRVRQWASEAARTDNGHPPETWQDELPPVAYKFIGRGRFVPGVPARDILVTEARWHPHCEGNMATAHPVYEKVTPC